jgi:FkbM family methyltransferase
LQAFLGRATPLLTSVRTSGSSASSPIAGGEKRHRPFFEPCSQTFARLRENVELNGLTNVHVHQLALSDKSETREMVTVSDGMDAWNSLAQPHAGQVHQKETIATRTWDEFAAEHGLVGKVTLMKIDVEGWEAPVLTGARQTLSRDDAPVLQVEFTEEAAVSAGFSCRGVYQQLEEYGYKIYRFEPAQHALVPDPMRESYGYINLFAVKNLGAAMERLQSSR